jgi:carbon-monoxide dehydrogenase medium subunit
MASVGPTTALLPRTRAAVEGARLDALDEATLARALAEDIKPIDDVRSTGEYRMHVARALVREAVLGR